MYVQMCLEKLKEDIESSGWGATGCWELHTALWCFNFHMVWKVLSWCV